ncbi:hypothetical protein B0H14DRAFT_3455356 [Mycena olivaceomarginata]|nr:hypothetical protein B0H14DRAFT_3455356 [Mycena olivaceomarginata]
MSSNYPRTTVSSVAAAPSTIFMNLTSDNTPKGVPNLGGNKAKPMRRGSTAERRATHNAVERQRREMLNGRFMDLGGMLPNLRDIRRPSKSAIVNSSIAHLEASHRHRFIAAHQLRIMKEEADALRHEINAWRARTGVALVEEPMRDEAFENVLSGELEFEEDDMLPVDGGFEEEELGSGGEHYVAGRVYPAESIDEYALLHHRQLEHAEMLRAQAHAQAQRAHFVHPETVHAFQPEYAMDARSPPYYTPAPVMPQPHISCIPKPRWMRVRQMHTPAP